MSDVVEPTSSPRGAMRKMSLTEAERKLIEDHRRKTAGDREFNAGLDHAREVIESIGEPPPARGWNDHVQVIVHGILAARRDV